MHELDADLSAIGGAHGADDLVERRRLVAEHAVDENRPVHVGFAEPVGQGVELRMGDLRRQAEGVEIGFQMAAYPIGANQHERPDRIERGVADIFGAQGPVAGDALCNRDHAALRRAVAAVDGDAAIDCEAGETRHEAARVLVQVCE